MSDVVIFGGGISGLTCALYLARGGVSVALYEKNDYLGGRASTVEADGFLLDRGFQVFLESYDEFPRILDTSTLRLCHFRSGAYIQDTDGLYQFVNPLHEPWSFINGLFSPWGTFQDKLRLGAMLLRALKVSAEVLPTLAEGSLSSIEYLEQNGFGLRTIHRLFRPFFGDVFLNRDLETSASFMLYLFRLFAFTKASLPADGIGGISKAIAKQLPAGAIQLQQPVVKQDENFCIKGQPIRANYYVVAGPIDMANTPGSTINWNSTHNLYYEVVRPTTRIKSLFLNVGGGPILNMAFLSEVQQTYAPVGKCLLSVTLNAGVNPLDADKLCRKQLRQWFGPDVDTYRLLQQFVLPKALPRFGQAHPITMPYFKAEGNVVFCGDYLAYPSLNGAASSGRQAAEYILKELSR